MSSPVDLFISALRARSNRVLSEKQGDYTLVVASIESRDVVFCFKRGSYSNVYYAKIALAEELSSLDCTELEYSPLGLYVFAENPTTLAENAIKKARALLGRRRSE